MDNIQNGQHRPRSRFGAGAGSAARARAKGSRRRARPPRVGQQRPDAVVEIRHGQHAQLYAANVKRNIQDATIGAVLLQRAGAEPPLLVADYVPPAVADKLKENNLPFIDAAGNAYVKAD